MPGEELDQSQRLKQACAPRRKEEGAEVFEDGDQLLDSAVVGGMTMSDCLSSSADSFCHAIERSPPQ
jgi:hypothetical protein